MKLKRLVDDFRVDEQLAPGIQMGIGPFACYRLMKQSLGTFEAVAAIARHWKLPRQAIAFAGLKDKHALTTQHITIHDGPRRGFDQSNFALHYLGQLDRPIHASDIECNRFVVVIRDLSRTEADRTAQAAATAAASGLPNYFDNQRFGSLGESGEFIAFPWCRGDYERAVWLALADPNVHDAPNEREDRRYVREHWGDRQTCRKRLPQFRFSGVLEHLAAEPNDYRRAIARFGQELRSLWLAAFQSHLWNQLLAEAIRESLPADRLSSHVIGGRSVPFFSPLEEPPRLPLADLQLPLPSARLHLVGETLRPLYDKVLAAEGLPLRQVRVKYPRDSFFSKGERAALFTPERFTRPEIADDELYRGRHKLTLEFSLARGTYATILVKCVVGEIGDDPEADADISDELVGVQ